MRKITDSHNSLKTVKSATIEKVVDFTGLPKDHITLLYESDNLDNFLELSGFKGNITKNELPKSFKISEEIKKILDSDELEQVKVAELNRLTTYASNLKNLDSIDILNGISELLIMNDTKSKNYILGINKLHDVNNTKLFESENISNNLFENNPNETLQLFESIQVLLNRQNKRWGNNYRLENTYNGIMSYLKADVERIMLANQLTSTDNNIHLDIINSYISGIHNPIYKDFSSLRTICPDVQTLVFDLMLLVEHYVICNTEALEYTKQSTLFDYRRISNQMIGLISSSLNKSKLVNCTLTNKLNNVFTNQEETTYNQNTPIITLLTNNIDFGTVKGFNLTINLTNASVHDMIFLINSCSVEFNLKIRPYLKQYVTKSLELVKSIGVCEYKLKQFKPKHG